MPTGAQTRAGAIMLRTKLFLSFAVLVLLFGTFSGWHAITIIRTRVIDEAQSRVALDIESARSLYNAYLREIDIVLSMAATERPLVETSRNEAWDQDYGEPASRLEQVRISFDLDFLTLVAFDGRVVLRTVNPYNAGDSKMTDPLVARALKGESTRATALLSQAELLREGESLGKRAIFTIEETKAAGAAYPEIETKGMVMMAAAPIRDESGVYGVLYGGVLLNRNHTMIDSIERAIYGERTYKGTPMGAATIFLKDYRVATTVRMADGSRALGTRVSREVSDRVIGGATPWVGRAFAVQDWYLAAYEPIRDVEGGIVGMLHVGVMEKPYRELARRVILQYLGLTGAGVLLALGLAFALLGRLRDVTRRLVDASQTIEHGEYPAPLPADKASIETGNLTLAFNDMVKALRAREEKLSLAIVQAAEIHKELREREKKLKEVNESLSIANRSYMETLGFVTHQMNTPVATMLNYAYLLQTGASGPLTEKQQKAVRVINDNLNRLTEMIRHYLNLSRIERDELRLSTTRFRVLEDVLKPLVESFEPQLAARRMRLIADVSPDLELKADINMTREVFENLFSNAVKYGRDGAEIRWSAERVNGFYRFTIRNEGEGIPEIELGKLFEKFKRIDETSAARRRGTGLGLFISRHIVEAHGGSIEAASKFGEWAEMRFTLPAFTERNDVKTEEGENDEQQKNSDRR